MCTSKRWCFFLSILAIKVSSQVSGGAIALAHDGGEECWWKQALRESVQVTCISGVAQWQPMIGKIWWYFWSGTVNSIICIYNRYMRNRLNSLCRSLLVRRSFSWKGLQTMESDMVNYQKRYLAISWNTISSLMFACKACSFLFHILAGPKAIPEAIPKRYPSGT